MEFSVLASSKAFWRGSSFCSLRWAKLQHEDPIDYNVLASNKAFWRRSSFCSLRRVKLWTSDFGLRTSDFHLFSLSILNTYILHKQRTFQRELVKELVRNSGIFPSLTPRGHPAKGLTHLQAEGQKEKILGIGKKSNITRAFMVCFPALKKILARTRDKRKRPGKESSFQYSVCKVALCMQDCFKLYPTV